MPLTLLSGHPAWYVVRELEFWVAVSDPHDSGSVPGGVARTKRDQMVERFQNERTDRVFLLSLKAAARG
jgi:hypothetical protein